MYAISGHIKADRYDSRLLGKDHKYTEIDISNPQLPSSTHK